MTRIIIPVASATAAAASNRCCVQTQTALLTMMSLLYYTAVSRLLQLLNACRPLCTAVIADLLYKQLDVTPLLLLTSLLTLAAVGFVHGS